MDYLYLIGSVLFLSSSSIFGTFYNRRNAARRDASPLYNLIYVCSVFLGWLLLFALDPSFEAAVLPYALAFGVFYTVCQIGIINSLKTGPVALSSLMLQLSLIGVTVWGFFFWDDPFTLPVAIGLVLVVISLWLCLCTDKPTNGAEKKITPKWLLFALMAFVGNAGCSITQRTQQMKYNGAHGNMLMVAAVCVSVFFCLFRYLRSDKSDSLAILKSTAPLPLIAGFLNVLLNLCVMLLATSPLSPGLIYPVLAVGGLAVTSLFSVLVFKEKLAFSQWIGIAVGAVAVALLSL